MSENSLPGGGGGSVWSELTDRSDGLKAEDSSCGAISKSNIRAEFLVSYFH